jgi:hypothetical protein
VRFTPPPREGVATAGGAAVGVLLPFAGAAAAASEAGVGVCAQAIPLLLCA